ncbi:MAG: primosomal protein N' [Clostridiales bacterium]|nr:primosomal protein N' [Clostridiales bacterium]
MIYADIIIDISHERLDRSFQYLVPEVLEREIRVGMVVQVPFGKGNRLRTGYVVGLSGESRYENGRLKEITALLSSGETTESRLISLAAWMRETYGSTMIQALRTVFPIKEKVNLREKRRICLTAGEEEAKALLEELDRSRFRARARFWRALLEEGSLDYTEAARELGASRSVLKYFEEKNFIRVESQGDTSGDEGEPRPVTLNEIQEKAYAGILEEWQADSPRPVLLFGVTGSGKTQVYMRLIRHITDQGKQAIVLIPEIALTYQTVRRFHRYFGDRVSVLNSRMSAGERYEQFRRAKKGEIQIMVGPRSALFTPFERLGLIIIDEEHEPTYKSENSPRYHARETAVHRASMENAFVVMGSATPSLEAFHRAQAGEYCLVRLDARFEERPLPQVSVVDLREELKKGNRSVLSLKLQQAMGENLERGEQTMLFLNRRGYAGFVSCRACGYVMKCPHCDVALSEHDRRRLLCHYCGYETQKPEVCPVCGSVHIAGFKAGTQQIEQVVRGIFPGIRVLRMDYDTTRRKNSYEQILSSFAAHEADVLVGTQMIVKGHDFPDVTLVGIVAADLSLNADDYRCGERTFQLLTQAVGRSGRGKKAGRALIQTYQPEHYSIQCAAVQDYDRFYREEISFRTLMNYPPASSMMAVLGSASDEESLGQAMYYLSAFARRVSRDRNLRMIGPAPAAAGKVKDVYRQVLYLRHEDSRFLIAVRERMEKYIEMNSGFRNIFIQFDLQ